MRCHTFLRTNEHLQRAEKISLMKRTALHFADNCNNMKAAFDSTAMMPSLSHN